MHVAQLMPLPLTVSCFSKIQIGFTFLVPAHPGSPGQRAIKQVSVLLCLSYPTKLTYRICRGLRNAFWLECGGHVYLVATVSVGGHVKHWTASVCPAVRLGFLTTRLIFIPIGRTTTGVQTFAPSPDICPSSSDTGCPSEKSNCHRGRMLLLRLELRRVKGQVLCKG